VSGDVLKVALAQLNLLVGDVQGNLARVIAESRLAGEQGADLVVFPELTLSGYPPEDLLFHRGLRAQVDDAVAALAAAIAAGPKDGAALPAVIVGYPEYEGSPSAPRLYNSAVLLPAELPRL
jgi:predicted amidohydrolase